MPCSMAGITCKVTWHKGDSKTVSQLTVRELVQNGTFFIGHVREAHVSRHISGLTDSLSLNPSYYYHIIMMLKDSFLSHGVYI